PHELEVLGAAAEAHDPLDAGPVVPGAVEEDDLPGRRQRGDVPLEVPLRGLPLAWLLQCDHTRPARVQMLHEALDRAALAGRVPPFEEDDKPLAGLLDRVLQLE